MTNPSAISASVVDNGNGSATANVSGGTSPYQYLWDANTGSQTTQTATGLSNGTFYVTITDNNGCQTTDSIIIFITNVTELGTGPIFNVYPNPNNGSFTADIQLFNTPNGTLSITNVLGQQLIYFNDISGHKIVPVVLTDFSKGIYYAILYIQNKAITRKIIVR